MKIAAHSACDVFSWYKYLIVNLIFSHLGFWNGNLYLVAPFPDLCLLVLSHSISSDSSNQDQQESKSIAFEVEFSK